MEANDTTPNLDGVTAPPSSTKPMPVRRPHRWKAVAAAGGMAAAVSLAGLGVASASTKSGANTPTAAVSTSTGTAQSGGPSGGPPGGPGISLSGSVTAIGADSITITSGVGGSKTVTTDSSTTYQKDGTSTTASALAVGEEISIRPASMTLTGSSTDVVAAAVDIVSPHLSGTVVAVGSGTLTIVDTQGFWHTIDVSAATTYELGGAPGTLSSVTVGADVVATGSVDADHTSLDAATVAVELPRVMGKVTAVSGSTITMTGRDNATVAVTTSSATAYDSSTGSASASSVTVGSMIVVEGNQPTSTTVTATSITVLPADASGARSGHGPGGPGGPGGFDGGPGASTS